MLSTEVQRGVRLNKKKKSTNISPYPDEAIERLAWAFYPAILACWNSEEGQREFAVWQAEQAHHGKKEKQEVLEELKDETRTIIIYEAPHRLVRTLKELLETLGDRRMTVLRELTKKHETAFTTTLSEAVAYYEAEAPRGECVLVLEGRSRQQMKEESQAAWKEMDIEEHMQKYLDQGMDKKEAMKQVAKDRGVSKRDIYQELLKK